MSMSTSTVPIAIARIIGIEARKRAAEKNPPMAGFMVLLVSGFLSAHADEPG